MQEISTILKSTIKPKEKQQALLKLVLEKKVTVNELIEYFQTAKDTEKGTCADVMKHVSAKWPEGFSKENIATLIRFVDYKAPRVKWGVAESLGNLSKQYPQETATAIPSLLENTTDNESNTTVIKWCAAYALTEIAKNNLQTRKELLPVFEKIIKREKNNGVRNVYVKAMKLLSV